MRAYNARNHYWTLAWDAANVYASARRSFVATRDRTYEDWRAAGHVPTWANVPEEIWAALDAAGASDLVSDEEVAARQVRRLDRLAKEIEDDGSDRAVLVTALVEALADRLPEASRVTRADVATKVRAKA